MTLLSEIHRAALDYAARGWSVIPIESRGKRPIQPWQEFQSRIASRAEIDDWFSSSPRANVAIVTGRVSGLVIIDIDAAHDGEGSIDRLQVRFAPLPETIEAITGGGGRHIYFRHPGGAVHNRVGVARGVDLRADGGCVVAPPSVHSSGKRYVWARHRGPGEIALAVLPGWVREHFVDRERSVGHPIAHWREVVRGGAGVGERNSTIASLAGHLLWHGVDPDVVIELLSAWNDVRCSPPLDHNEVVRTVRSITRLHSRES